MQPQALILFAAGIVMLIGGAELLVRGASQLAARFGVSPLIIGLTVVAFGTGSPELAVGVRAALAGHADIAVGNVVGSNIFNVLFILGVSALVTPLVVHDQLIRLDVPIMILASFAVFPLALDRNIGSVDGAILVAGIIAYTALLVRLGRKQRLAARLPAIEPAGAAQGRIARLLDTFFIGAGLALLALGSDWLVTGATQIATALGVSQLVIGLTIVAAGTSLPEVATTVIAGIRGQREIAVGNVIGSNIYNILAVLGSAALLAPGGLTVAPAAIRFDIPVMIAVAVACLPIFFTRGMVSRWEGAIFLAYWFAYTAYVFLLAAEHDAVDEFGHVMSFYVIPLTILTMSIILTRVFRARRREGSRSGRTD
jgi:cation:H+ antiporter